MPIEQLDHERRVFAGIIQQLEAFRTCFPDRTDRLVTVADSVTGDLRAERFQRFAGDFAAEMPEQVFGGLAYDL